MRLTLLSAALALLALLAPPPAAAVSGGGNPTSPAGKADTALCVARWNKQASGPPLDAGAVTVRDFLGAYPPDPKTDFAPSPPAPTPATTFYWYQTIVAPDARAFVCRLASTSPDRTATSVDWMTQLPSPPATAGCAGAMAKCAARWNEVGGVFLVEPLGVTRACMFDDAKSEWIVAFTGKLDGADPAPTPGFTCRLSGKVADDPAAGSVTSVSCDRYGKQ